MGNSAGLFCLSSSVLLFPLGQAALSRSRLSGLLSVFASFLGTTKVDSGRKKTAWQLELTRPCRLGVWPFCYLCAVLTAALSHSR